MCISTCVYLFIHNIFMKCLCVFYIPCITMHVCVQGGIELRTPLRVDRIITNSPGWLFNTCIICFFIGLV